MKKPLLFLTCLLISVFVYPQITFERTYGAPWGGRGRSVAQTSDSGYIITGSKIDSLDHNHIWLVKTNQYGDTLWTRVLENTISYGNSVAQISDGGYIITGYKYNGAYKDVCLIRTNACGNKIWGIFFGGSYDDMGNSVTQTKDGGFIITGSKAITTGSNSDVYLIKTDTGGNAIWTKTYGGNMYEEGNFVAQTSDSGYIISGITASFGAGENDLYLIRTDKNGDTLWTKNYGSTFNDEGQRLALTNDNGFIITGGCNGYLSYVSNVYLIKTDSVGETMWTKAFSGSYFNYGYSVVQSNDGGYAITGETRSSVSGPDLYLIKTNAYGDSLWSKTFGGPQVDYGSCIKQTTDGGYIISGNTFDVQAFHSNLYLIKTDANGHVAGIDNYTSAMNNRITIYPNPTNGQVNIQIPNKFGQTKTLEVFDYTGHLQYTRTDNFSDIDISSLTSGLYFIVLTSPDNEKITSKIIKM